MKIASFERMTQLIASGKEREAEKESQNMIDENPSHYAGYLCLAYVYSKTRRKLDLAASYIEQALLYNQTIVENYLVAISIYEQLHKTKRILELARFGLTLDYTQAEFYEALAKNGNFNLTEKIALYEKALLYSPNQVSYMGILSELLFKQNPRDKRAFELQNLAFATKPDDIPNLFRFAKMSYARCDFEKAFQLAERAVCLAPNETRYQEFYQEMKLVQNPFFGTYEKARLYTHYLPAWTTVTILLAYTLFFIWGLATVGYLAIVMWIIPLSILIVAFLVQAGAGEAKTVQAKQNLYVRLPIAIITLLALFIPAGIQVVSLASDTVKEKITVQKQVSEPNEAYHVQYDETPTRVATTAEDHHFNADYNKLVNLRALVRAGEQNDAVLEKYVASSYLPTFKQKIKEASNYEKLMNARFYQMLNLDSSEKAYLTQENNQFDLIILFKAGKISHIYGHTWTTDAKEKLAMEGMMPHIVTDGKYTELNQ
ncbi:tetratricopeptide repeat protein [Listeria fleischmannii]|uniref:Uncharacterized protein n=1 Tax=Listeria fleischmannii TaxID=1069827 RepID=A0A841YD77_9LIST|nr:hypothetical protein [Listeria fleischmannii]EIA20652.1 hypothetical protein KKC_05797 [Listeria fleischmannii subsp. coloradonensis]MBC1398302.1 hypothetical protein [Listeria fleischmannii]MBC1426363.1 hypothetical protein [Listeria fleischmannii]STY35630.1 Uncharacterised protein [Listeria fleischmannii subsp. coloradonensis]